MLRAAISNQIFEGWDIARAMEYVAGLEYDGIEIAPSTLANSALSIPASERKRISQAAKSAGLQIVGLHSVLKSPTETLHINHADAGVRAHTVAYIHALIDLCADLDASLLVMGSPRQRGIYPGLTASQAWGYTVDTFAQTMDRAERNHVTLCMEPIASFLTDFVTTVDEALCMVADVNHPNFQMMIDVRSSSYDNEPIPDLIRKSASHLVHLHANDDNGRGPGTGNASYHDIAAAIRDIGYDGYLSVEVFHFDEGPEAIATQSMASLRKYFAI